MTPRRLLSALALAALLAGCAQLPRTEPAGSAPRPARALIETYTLTGRIAVRKGEQHYAVNLTWQHGPQRDEILFATPLGQGLAELTRDAAGARLTTAEHREFAAADWQGLSAQVFGFSLPLEALPRWLVGVVPNDALGVTRDAAGRPQRMVSDDWQVAYLGYESPAADALPSLLELKRDDIEVRLKIDDWQVP
ncbi:MAG: outer membrane lipoprotein LolB [Betaproteobacteria bacterium]|nr:outer membrane lipoprotein LolB [Betaproteobacteria bacterium]